MSAALLLACALASAAAGETFPAPRADPRVELLGAVRLLAGDERGATGFYRRDLPYERELARRLQPFAGHPAVARWLELERAGLGYVPAYQWVLTLGDPPGLEARGALQNDVAKAAGGAEGLEEFRLMLADFSRAADFPRVYAETAPLREPMVDDVRAQAASGGFGAALERYWGGPVAVRYTLIVSEFVEPAIAVTALARDADGTPRLTSVTGAEEFEGRVRPRLIARRGTLWAEALNEALKPAFAARADALKASAPLLGATSGRCAGTWEDCARKEAAFAAATRMLALAGDKASADEWPIKYARVGMPHIAALVEALKSYAPARGGGTLADFVPRLLSVYDALASSAPAPAPFSLGIAAALADPAPCVLVAPRAPSPELATALARFRRERRLCDAEATPEEALARGLAGRGVVAVGALSENAWLAKRWAQLQLPAHVEAGGLRMNPRPGETRGAVYAGRIGFVSVARNPDDVARPVLLFTGEDPALIPPLLAGFPETADYEIRDGSASVKAGIYEKSRLPWRAK